MNPLIKLFKLKEISVKVLLDKVSTSLLLLAMKSEILLSKTIKPENVKKEVLLTNSLEKDAMLEDTTLFTTLKSEF